MWPNTQVPADLVTFTEEILNWKLHFLCSKNSIRNNFPFPFSFLTLYTNRSSKFSWYAMFVFLWSIVHFFLKLVLYPHNGFILTISESQFETRLVDSRQKAPNECTGKVTDL